MGLIRFFAILLAVVLAALTGLYAWLGGFERIEVSKGGWGPAEIMFATHRGPYKNIGESWAAFEEAWTAAGLDACDGLAVNLDPPETDPAALRSILGCRIDALDEATKTKMADAFPTAILPATEAYLARFPYKNELSYVLGPLKVYPAMRKRFEADGARPAVGIEVYGVGGQETHIGFVLPVSARGPEEDVQSENAYQALYDAFD